MEAPTVGPPPRRRSFAEQFGYGQGLVHAFADFGSWENVAARFSCPNQASVVLERIPIQLLEVAPPASVASCDPCGFFIRVRGGRTGIRILLPPNLNFAASS